jgi:hypothetical protein
VAGAALTLALRKEESFVLALLERAGPKRAA